MSVVAQAGSAENTYATVADISRRSLLVAALVSTPLLVQGPSKADEGMEFLVTSWKAACTWN
jgi:hypothetical protein